LEAKRRENGRPQQKQAVAAEEKPWKSRANSEEGKGK
jgi:hypothetical protein